MSGKEFAKWMDDVGIDLSAAASLFGVSEQTIYNWRSTRGVADSKADWVESRMRDYLGSREITSLPDRVTLEITSDQFDNWNQAALAEGKTLRQWAIDSLESIAADNDDSTGYTQPSNPLQSLPLVADEGKPYEAPASDSATTARLGSSSLSDSEEGVA